MDSSSPLSHLPEVSTRPAAGLHGDVLGVVAGVIGGVLWATTQWLAWLAVGAAAAALCTVIGPDAPIAALKTGGPEGVTKLANAVLARRGRP